jgi:hypothetical protein
MQRDESFLSPEWLLSSKIDRPLILTEGPTLIIVDLAGTVFPVGLHYSFFVITNTSDIRNIFQ